MHPEWLAGSTGWAGHAETCTMQLVLIIGCLSSHVHGPNKHMYCGRVRTCGTVHRTRRWWGLVVSSIWRTPGLFLSVGSPGRVRVSVTLGSLLPAGDTDTTCTAHEQWIKLALLKFQVRSCNNSCVDCIRHCRIV